MNGVSNQMSLNCFLPLLAFIGIAPGWTLTECGKDPALKITGVFASMGGLTIVLNTANQFEECVVLESNKSDVLKTGSFNMLGNRWADPSPKVNGTAICGDVDVGINASVLLRSLLGRARNETLFLVPFGLALRLPWIKDVAKY